MRNDTVVTGQDSDGTKHAGAAGWSVPGYTELKALGSGGFGDVVLARRDATGALVAIKYMRRKLLADPQWAQMFRAEAQVLAILDDPNIVRLHEYAESPSGAAIVMELVDGVSVREILADQGATTPEAALVVLRGSLLGLAAAHRRGVVHRDYKPENVLVDGNGASKLTDFGIAARTGQRAGPGRQLDVRAARAVRRRRGQPGRGCVRGHGHVLRVPDRPAAVHRGHGRAAAVPAPDRAGAAGSGARAAAAAGRRRDGQGAREPAGRRHHLRRRPGRRSQHAAYGPDWDERGRSHLGEAALLLAALWPSAAPPAVQGSAVEQVNLSRNAQESRDIGEARHLWHLGHLRHLLHLRDRRGRRAWRLSPVKAAVAIATAVVVVAAGAALAVRGSSLSSSSLPHPVVAGVLPASGSTKGGTSVTITGTGLARATRVGFGRAAAQIITDTSTQITAISPAGTGTVDVTVTTPGGTSQPAAARFVYTTSPPSSHPVVTGVLPASGSTKGGTSVTITGTGLSHAASVSFGGKAATIRSDSATQVTVTSPSGTGTVHITVTTPAGRVTAVGTFTYVSSLIPASPPVVTGVTPATGPAKGGTPVTLTGTDLFGATGVSFGGAAGAITTESATQITVISPAGTGTVDVTVTTRAGTSQPAATAQFAYTQTATTTTTTVTSSLNPSLAGHQVSLTATVRPAPGTGTPTGTVTFYDDGTQLGSAPLDSSGTATITTSALEAGIHKITASYGGDQNFTASTGSLTQTVNVNQAAPTATATATVSPASYSGSTCPAVFTFSGTIHVSSGPVTVTYRWIRSDGAIAPEQTINFTGSGAQDQSVAPETWTLSANGTHWEAIQIVSPGSAQSNEATFTLNCQAAPTATATATVSPASYSGSTCPAVYTVLRHDPRIERPGHRDLQMDPQ